MTYVQQVLQDGKNNLLATGFYGPTANEFRYMAFGTSTNAPTESGTHTLGQECTNSDYLRVELTNTVDTANRRITCQGTLPTTNITASTALTEVGICDASSGNAVFYCVCQIPQITKDSSKSVTITVTSTFGSS